MKVYQIWYETDVGPVFSSREKAIEHINKQNEKYGRDPYDPSEDYPDIREFEVDTGYINTDWKIDAYDR